jgi:hypothetical protein
MNGRLAARASGLHKVKGKHYDVMIARLQLPSHRAHWIEVTRTIKTDKTDFHKVSDFLSASFNCDGFVYNL